MTMFGSLLSRLAADRTASMAIETALVAPVLITMAIGGFEASSMVAKQSELQSAAAEAISIAIAAQPDTYKEVQTVRNVIKASTGLDNDHVFVYRKYRCGTDEDYVFYEESCAEGAKVSTFLYIYILDSYTPTWVDFGVGETLQYRVQRMVQIS